ncbi:MAG: HAD-IB family phosphatase [Candidatus Magasanikbacteria bacterium]|nr:HAD-IB family phosphatase [Candidatus Magasanikbacteria bacterium]
MNNKTYNKIFFDFDSTIISCESLDLLADMKDIGEEVRRMTKLSMDGVVALEDVFSKKMSLISPSKNDIEFILNKCKSLLVDGMESVISVLLSFEKDVFILSSNFHCIVDPIAEVLHIPSQNVLANNLQFLDGKYNGMNTDSLLATARGKAQTIKQYINKSDRVVMVGDSVSDSYCREVVDLFIGFGGVEKRAAVQAVSDVYVEHKNMLTILPVILSRDEMRQLKKGKPKLVREIEVLPTTTTTTNEDS